MSNQSLEGRLARARQLLAEIHHVPIATANEDGSPHNSPVFMAFDDKLCGFWASDQSSLHSKNIARDGRVFLVVFDSREGHGGLYIEARATALEEGPVFKHGYQTLKQLGNKGFGNTDLYQGVNPQRIYQAVPSRMWVNHSERNADGAVIHDRRVEMPLKQLLLQ